MRKADILLIDGEPQDRPPFAETGSTLFEKVQDEARSRMGRNLEPALGGAREFTCSSKEPNANDGRRFN
jgi:hypothetical protein